MVHILCNRPCSSSHFGFSKNIEVTEAAVAAVAVTTVLEVAVPEVSVGAVFVAEVGSRRKPGVSPNLV